MRLELLAFLDPAGAWLQRRGLTRASRAGRRLYERVFGTSVAAFVAHLCGRFGLVEAIDEPNRRLVPIGRGTRLEDFGPVFNVVCSREGLGSRNELLTGVGADRA